MTHPVITHETLQPRPQSIKTINGYRRICPGCGGLMSYETLTVCRTCKVRRADILQPDDPFIRHIPLTCGLYVVVDTHLYEWLIQWPWRARRSRRTWYAERTDYAGGTCKTMVMHRLIVGLDHGVRRIVDHHNGDGLDNRGINLRFADKYQNGANAAKYRTNTSGYKGVSWHKIQNGWYVKLVHENVMYSTGYFPLAQLKEAAREHDRKAYELQGEFSHLNFPDETPGSPRFQWWISRNRR